MRTPKQIAASRPNGRRSSPQRRTDHPPSHSAAGPAAGLAVSQASKAAPVTPQGKFNSSRNSLRHGLLARTIVLAEESTERFLELLDALINEFHPSTATQHILVETMAAARWRLLRIWGFQKTSLDREIALQDPALGTAEVRAVLAFNQSAKTLQPDLLLRYEVALDRQFHRALNQLLALQSNQANQRPQPHHPASLPTQTVPTQTLPTQTSTSPQRRGDAPASESSAGSSHTQPTPPSQQPSPAKRTQQVVDPTDHAPFGRNSAQCPAPASSWPNALVSPASNTPPAGTA